MLGIIIDVCTIIIGGAFGALFGHKLPKDFKEKLTAVFGIRHILRKLSTIVLS